MTPIICNCKSQHQAVLEYLGLGKSITPLKARHLFGVERLADVVYKLKKKGHDVCTELKQDENNKRYAEYWLRGATRA